MKLRLSSVIVITILSLIFTSCAEKTKMCKMDHETSRGYLYVDYTYNGDRLVQADIYDTNGVIRNVYEWTYNSGGKITHVTVHDNGSLSYSNSVFINNNNQLDSIQVYYDTDSNNIADIFGASYIYHYTGDKITTIERRYEGSAPVLYMSWEYTGNNITKVTYNISGNYYVYTYSGLKDPYYRHIFMENLVSEPSPIWMSENLADNRKYYNSSDVLQTDINYVNSEIENGVQTYYPNNGNTRQWLFECTEQ